MKKTRCIAILLAVPVLYAMSYGLLRASRFLVQRSYFLYSQYEPHRYEKYFDPDYGKTVDVPVIYVVTATDVGHGRFWSDVQNQRRSSAFWTHVYWPLWQSELRLRGGYEFEKWEQWIYE